MNLKKWLLGLTVLATSITLAACGNPVQIDPVIFDTYTNCRVNLSYNAYIVGPTENMRFWVDGKEVNPNDIIPGNWVNCEKIDPGKPGIFIIKTIRPAPDELIRSSYIKFAKQGQGEFCPHWARQIFGRQCQSGDLSIH